MNRATLVRLLHTIIPDDRRVADRGRRRGPARRPHARAGARSAADRECLRWPRHTGSGPCLREERCTYLSEKAFLFRKLLPTLLEARDRGSFSRNSSQKDRISARMFCEALTP